MKNNEILVVPHFQQFITDSYKGKRLKPNGNKIKSQTIDNYYYPLQYLKEYELKYDVILRIKMLTGNNKKQILLERNYWKRFFQLFNQFLYTTKNCHDNYVGNITKMLKTYFNYLKKEKLYPIGDFYNQFPISKEDIPIITLLPEQLYFLIHDKKFEDSLPFHLVQTKDKFVFGCTVALRYSDIDALKFTDVDCMNNTFYLSTKAIKTDISMRIKLPDYLVDIINMNKQKASRRKTIFPSLSNSRFSINLKQLCELAGWTKEIGKIRNKRGCKHEIKNSTNGKGQRFCDLVSSHTMRRTAITTMLMLGMPEHVVKRISGHTADSKVFYRYVNLVQSYLDTEIDKVYLQMGAK